MYDVFFNFGVEFVVDSTNKTQSNNYPRCYFDTILQGLMVEYDIHQYPR